MAAAHLLNLLTIRIVCLLTLLAVRPIACSSHAAPPPSLLQSDNRFTFSWNTLAPALTLEYKPCYDGFECARLEVPLDWTNTSNPNTVQLAVIRLPATVPETDAAFGGTILFNPGGPGGSGVDFLAWTGHGLRSIVDSERHFELLSWDPRGVHFSTPSSSCFEDDFQRQLYLFRNNVLGPMDASEVSFTEKWALAEGLGKLCGQTEQTIYPDGSNILQHATTASAVRDMIEIIDQVEKRRSDTATTHLVTQNQRILQFRQPALLNYWGYSYGSYLGNAFASMFPSRVGRMILDSVVDTDDYTAAGWLSNLQDHHKGLELFYKYCFDAGAKCALNSPDADSAEDMALKVEKLLEDLKQEPLVVIHDGIPQVVRFADISNLLLESMYTPLQSWQMLSQILADLLEGNGTSIVPFLPQLNAPGKKSDEDDMQQQMSKGRNNSRPYPPNYPHSTEAAHTVICSDGDDTTNLTAEDWHLQLNKFANESAIVGWKWSEIPMVCAHWPRSIRAAEQNRFTGPFSSRLADYDSRASPLLFIGGTADPALPLRNAFKAASRHEGAHVLIRDAPGHCSGHSNPNECIFRHVKEFFAEGLLPLNGTICDVDRTPWSEDGRV